MTLDNIGLRHGTDKASSFHNYLVTYEKYFDRLRDKPVRLLESGVLKGSSLKTWREYFKDGSIWGIDVDPNCLQELPMNCVGVHGNTNDPGFWESFQERDFDIIIDDGDHAAESQLRMFHFAFPRLVSGGLYIIEDIHFSQGAILNGILPVLAALNDYWLGDCGNPEKGASDVRFVHFYKSLILIGKR